jgi:serine beta-lactamase-like protein LACTB, mitochondrial
MRTSAFTITFLLLLLMIGGSVVLKPTEVVAGNSPSQSTEGFAEPIQNGRNLVTELVKREGIPGLSITVAVDGKLVWSEGFGVADLEGNVAASARTRYRIGSVSKLLTSAALARLYDKGRIDLDASVQRYVPSFPKKEQDITIRQLAGHLSGIRHYSRDEYINRQNYRSLVETLAVFKDSPLLFQPGTKYSYSSYGFNLIGAVIESAAGQDFLTCLSQEVFAPLKMESTVADNVQSVIPNRTRFYSLDSGRVVNGAYIDLSDRLPSGGFLSTADDLARFGSAFLIDGFLKPETRTLMFTSQKTTDGKETGVGLGWRIGKDAQGRRIWHHGGDSIGGRAFLLIYPEQKIVVAILTNLSSARFAEQDAAKLGQLFMK